MPELAKLADEKKLMYAGAGILLVSIGAAIIANEPLICLAPIAFLLAYQLLIDYRPVFYLLLLSTPVALEYQFESGLGTDIPTEPLEILLMFTFIFYVILQKEHLRLEFFRHPISVIIYIHFAWILITTLFSTDIAISFKYVLAKIWYITTFYFVAAHVMRKAEDFKIAFWLLFIPTLIVVINTLINHYNYQFRFSEVNKTMYPIFRNHVNYAVFLSLMLPFVFLASTWYKKYSWQKMLLNLSKLIFIAAIYFAYTRSSWLSVIAALAGFIIIRKRILGWAVAFAVVAVGVFAWYMLQNNTYLKYAPDYKKTIYHQDFSEHIASTATLEDVSSAERIYRWVAGINMIKEKPITGFGPSQFYYNYKEYAVNKFTTYISRNEEKSTIHNYYLTITCEQGFPGLLIWLVLIISVLMLGQKLYYRCSGETKLLALTLTLSFITILVNISLSDLIEADKIGTMFFLIISLLVTIDINSRKKIVSGE